MSFYFFSQILSNFWELCFFFKIIIWRVNLTILGSFYIKWWFLVICFTILPHFGPFWEKNPKIFIFVINLNYLVQLWYDDRLNFTFFPFLAKINYKVFIFLVNLTILVPLWRFFWWISIFFNNFWKNPVCWIFIFGVNFSIFESFWGILGEFLLFSDFQTFRNYPNFHFLVNLAILGSVWWIFGWSFKVLLFTSFRSQNFHFCGIFDHFTALLDNFTFASFLVVFSPTFSFLGQFYHIKCHFD